MRSSAQYLSPSEAARRLGVSAKALRLYEQRGLIAPVRTEAGWRAYGPEQMARAAEIVALRALGLSLGQVARALAGDAQALEPGPGRASGSARKPDPPICRHRREGPLRAPRSAAGQAPTAGELVRLLKPAAGLTVAFDLPWPWGGERFELNDIRPLNFIIGPLGSGKTRLAMRLAETLPDAAFLGLDRLADGGAAARARLDADAALKSRVDRALAWLVEDGATASDALVALLAALEADAPAVLVVDMLEQGLDQATQEALIAHLRRRGTRRAPALLPHALQRHLGPGCRGRRRGDHPMPRQSQPADLRCALSPALPATRRWPPAWPRPTCGRGPKASSPGGARHSSKDRPCRPIAACCRS